MPSGKRTLWKDLRPWSAQCKNYYILRLLNQLLILRRPVRLAHTSGSKPNFVLPSRLQSANVPSNAFSTMTSGSVVQTISNPDGTVSIIQVDPSNPVIQLSEGGTAHVQGLAQVSLPPPPPHPGPPSIPVQQVRIEPRLKTHFAALVQSSHLSRGANVISDVSWRRFGSHSSTLFSRFQFLCPPRNPASKQPPMKAVLSRPKILLLVAEFIL